MARWRICQSGKSGCQKLRIVFDAVYKYPQILGSKSP
jgi:hypothetical protein